MAKTLRDLYDGGHPLSGGSGRRAVPAEQILRELQNEIEERGGSREVLIRRRSILRGVRAGLWALEPGTTAPEFAEALRAELFTQEGKS